MQKHQLDAASGQYQDALGRQPLISRCCWLPTDPFVQPLTGPLPSRQTHRHGQLPPCCTRYHASSSSSLSSSSSSSSSSLHRLSSNAIPCRPPQRPHRAACLPRGGTACRSLQIPLDQSQGRPARVCVSDKAFVRVGSSMDVGRPKTTRPRTRPVTAGQGALYPVTMVIVDRPRDVEFVAKSSATSSDDPSPSS